MFPVILVVPLNFVGLCLSLAGVRSEMHDVLSDDLEEVGLCQSEHGHKDSAGHVNNLKDIDP